MTIRIQIIYASLYHACHSSKSFYLFIFRVQLSVWEFQSHDAWLVFPSRKFIKRIYNVCRTLFAVFSSDIDRMHFNFLCFKILRICLFLFSSFLKWFPSLGYKGRIPCKVSMSPRFKCHLCCFPRRISKVSGPSLTKTPSRSAWYISHNRFLPNPSQSSLNPRISLASICYFSCIIFASHQTYPRKKRDVSYNNRSRNV